MAGVIIISPDNEDAGISTGDELAVGVYADIENDILYFSDAQAVYEWEGHASNLQTFTWKSGKLRARRPINLGAAVVEADSYSSLTLKLYAEINNMMTLKHTQTVTSVQPFRLPDGYLSQIFEIELTGTDVVTSVRVGESIFDLVEEG